jgi:hypothetical protein
MEPRLKSGFRVKALVRRVQAQGAQAFITRRGDEDAGAILITLNGLQGSSKLLSQARNGMGDLIWLMVSGPDPQADADIAADIAKRCARDPDLWVVEIESREFTAFVDEPIEVVTERPR